MCSHVLTRDSTEEELLDDGEWDDDKPTVALRDDEDAVDNDDEVLDNDESTSAPRCFSNA